MDSRRRNDRQTVALSRFVSLASLAIEGHASPVFELKYVDSRIATARSAPDKSGREATDLEPLFFCRVERAAFRHKMGLRVTIDLRSYGHLHI